MSFLRSRRHSDQFKWWVLSCTSLGMLLATVNSGTLIIALPDLERSLHTTLLQLVWVILVYMIVSTRVLQGVGGAFLFANSAALVTDAFPKRELGLAMGTNTMVAAVGLVIGPVLGGALVAIAWPWVFWFNVPLALIGSAWGLLVLEERAGRSDARGLDLLGATL